MKTEKIKYDIVESKEGLPTILIHQDGKKIPLHSKIYPSKEKSIIKITDDCSRIDTLIILGMGMGYHLTELNNIAEQFSLIIIIDIIDDIENSIESLTHLINLPNVKLYRAVDTEKIESIFIELMDFSKIKGIKVIEHPQSMRIFPEYYIEVKKICEQVIDKKASTKATHKAFGHLYFKNILKNLQEAQTLSPVSSFFNRFGDCPAIIIIPGPSIEKELENLKSNEDKFFIIAVDSALSMLKSYSIKADFVISIDPQYYISEHFQNSDCEESAIIFSISANSSSVKKRGGYISLNSHPICQIMEEMFSADVGTVDSLTGSVTGDAVNFAFKAGFHSIGIIGADFSFSDFKIYARGTAYQLRFSRYFQDRFSTVETFNFNYIFKSSRGFKKDGLFTRRSFLLYKESLEKFLSKSKIDNLYNLNSIGFDINGAERISLESFLNSKCVVKMNKKDILYDIKRNSRKLEDVIPIKKLKTVISDDSILKEIITTSEMEIGRFKPDFWKKIIEKI